MAEGWLAAETRRQPEGIQQCALCIAVGLHKFVPMAGWLG